jgi:hypothetical protein
VADDDLNDRRFRVGILVTCDAPGGDPLDAAHVAEMVLRRLGDLTVEHRDHGTLTVNIVQAREVSTAVRNGALTVSFPWEVRAWDDPRHHAPAGRDELETAARWLADHAHPNGRGIPQEGGLSIPNLIGNPSAAYFAAESAIKRGADEPTTRRHLDTLEHAARLNAHRW